MKYEIDNFPSLKGKLESDGGLGLIAGKWIISLEDLQKYCIDKEKLREAIEKWLEMSCHRWIKGDDIGLAESSLKKEVGLE